MKVDLFTRTRCHLCEAARAVIDRVRADVPFDLAVHDIDRDPELQRRYDWDVPVIVVEGRQLARHRLDEAEFRQRLAEAELEGA